LLEHFKIRFGDLAKGDAHRGHLLTQIITGPFVETAKFLSVVSDDSSFYTEPILYAADEGRAY
jgi:hypothetical protein